MSVEDRTALAQGGPGPRLESVTSSRAAERRLRFLFVTNAPWARELGVSHVLIELASALVDQGHSVAKFSHEDAFPGRRPLRVGTLGRIWGYLLAAGRDFSPHARRFVRARNRDFDVIDAGMSDIPYSKRSLLFSGLLVTRVPALIPAYDAFERDARRRWPTRWTLREIVRNSLGAPKRHRVRRRWARSCSRADLINVSNADDYAFLAARFGADKVARYPLGLTEEFAGALAQSATRPVQRLAKKRVVFIGTWNARKGAHDWPSIIRQTAGLCPTVRFLFLGTDMREEVVLASIPSDLWQRIEVRPRFRPADLPLLLGSATVGAFPGYLEGFGLGVLEMLASGLPVVGYDAPGTRDMLRQVAGLQPVRTGDVESFSRSLAAVLSSSADVYSAMASESLRVSQGYRWSAIARHTAESYSDRLAGLRP